MPKRPLRTKGKGSSDHNGSKAPVGTNGLFCLARGVVSAVVIVASLLSIHRSMEITSSSSSIPQHDAPHHRPMTDSNRVGGFSTTPPTTTNQNDAILENNNEQPQEEPLDEETRKLVQDLNNRPIHFMAGTHNVNDRVDAFSASWLQRKQDFLLMNYTEILSCEDAAFHAYWGENLPKMRLTVDWFDFAIEHMSKWHKILAVYEPGQEVIYDTIISKLDKYMAASSLQVDESFRETIAVIAFQPYDHPQKADMARQLTVRSLGATLESLRRAGFGRVTVVSLEAADREIVQETVQHLRTKLGMTAGGSSTGVVGTMEIAHALGSLEIAKARWVEKNVPKAALGGLWEAFQLADKDATALTPVEADYVQTWLGGGNWKYVYLTEPDCILQTRPTSLKQLKAQVDQGSVLVPHRLQPIPHESDAKGSSRDYLYLPQTFVQPVVELDPNGRHDVCCDNWKGHGTKPGLPPQFPDCGNFWYQCDFGPDKHKRPEAHQRLKPYGLMRLQGGTGIVSLAASEHGRPCVFQKQGFCNPKP